MGKWRYNLYLHGFFFVDSGRRGIQPFDELPDDMTPDAVESESQVTQLWNRTLLHELVAPLVLPSLDAFVKQERMESTEVEALVRSLGKSGTLIKLTDWMCDGQRFEVFFLHLAGVGRLDVELLDVDILNELNCFHGAVTFK